LPRYGFPSSLKVLSICRCPLLKARYATRRRGHVSKIAHIPVLKINYEVIIWTMAKERKNCTSISGTFFFYVASQEEFYLTF
jgi:hypothetical protein